jgi:putative membrane protein
VSPIVALLHPGQPIDWLRWTVHPSTVLGIGALGALYLWRARAGFGTRHSALDTRRRHAAEPPSAEPPSAAQRLCFGAGLLVLFAALNGPIHDLSDYYLFSAHMVQHLLLTMVVMPLLIAGTSGWMVRPLLRWRAVDGAARAVTAPGVCYTLFNVTIIAWHLPPLYNLAMANHGVHIVQHLCFLAASGLMWWPLMSPLPELPRLSLPKQMLYVVLLMLPMSIVGMSLTYADRVLYPAYEGAPRIWGISPREDQMIGGLIMWIPGGLALIGVATVVFFRWAATESAEPTDAAVDTGAPSTAST